MKTIIKYKIPRVFGDRVKEKIKNEDLEFIVEDEMKQKYETIMKKLNGEVLIESRDLSKLCKIVEIEKPKLPYYDCYDVWEIDDVTMLKSFMIRNNLTIKDLEEKYGIKEKVYVTLTHTATKRVDFDTSAKLIDLIWGDE